jgi:hypothetical protein
MKKETAVEWLIDELRNQIAEGTLNAITISDLKMLAKAKEKQQIEDAFMEEKVKWVPQVHDDGRISISNEIAYANGEEYYNQTYK